MLLVIASIFLSSQVLGDPINADQFGNIGDYPWIASIQTRGYHKCAGSIISESVVLTAAHCLEDLRANSYIVRVGSSRTDSGGSWHSVVAIKIHPKFEWLGGAVPWADDLAMMKVRPSFRFNKTVSMIWPAKAGQALAPGTSLRSAGWNGMSRKVKLSPELRTIDLHVVDKWRCDRARRVDDAGKNVSTYSMICASEPASDACGGDPGGPLVAKGYLVGIVSADVGCAVPEYPGIYVDVSSYRDWIDKNSLSMELLH